MTFTIGQTVLVEFRTFKRYDEFTPPIVRTVTKVGRKWVFLTDGGRPPQRFAVVDGEDDERRDAANDGPYHLDGGDYTSPGRVWRDQAHLDAYRAKEAAWVRVTSKARERSTMPAHLTTDQLEAIAELLEGDER